MTIFDLLFLLLLVSTVAALVTAAVSAVRGGGAKARGILSRVALCAASYIAVVYIATALSKPVVLGVGDPQCSDDWCLSVEGVKRTPGTSAVVYDVTLRIFSRARRVAQREMAARDVYLVDAGWDRYDPMRTGVEIPLNTLLQAGESVTTSRKFQLPAESRATGLMIDRGQVMFVPICLIIGECGAFHKGTIVRID